MGLMDFLQPFAKGYFEGSVDIMQTRAKEKADAKRLADEYKARLTNELTILEKTNELTEKNNIINEQKNKIKEQDDVLEHFKNVTVNRRTKHMRSSNLNDTYYD